MCYILINQDSIQDFAHEKDKYNSCTQPTPTWLGWGFNDYDNDIHDKYSISSFAYALIET